MKILSTVFLIFFKDRLLLTLPCFFIFFSSCVSQKMTSLEGVFYGILPCADCLDIHYELTLEGDNMYFEKILYTGKSSEVLIHSGYYELLQDRVITLVDKPLEDGMRQFAIEGDRLRMLDLSGGPIQGKLADFYVLSREKPRSFSFEEPL
jgi:copper homeostasis protein (lipoprotein)